MRTNKDIFKSLNDTINDVLSDKEEPIEEQETIEEQGDDTTSLLPDINKLSDSEVADYIIRYNQVVNRALRARFMSKTKRKAV